MMVYLVLEEGWWRRAGCHLEQEVSRELMTSFLVVTHFLHSIPKDDVMVGQQSHSNLMDNLKDETGLHMLPVHIVDLGGSPGNKAFQRPTLALHSLHMEIYPRIRIHHRNFVGSSSYVGLREDTVSITSPTMVYISQGQVVYHCLNEVMSPVEMNW